MQNTGQPLPDNGPNNWECFILRDSLVTFVSHTWQRKKKPASEERAVLHISRRRIKSKKGEIILEYGTPPSKPYSNDLAILR